MCAFVRCFGAVIQAVGAFTGFAPEGKKVKLVAVGVLAVGADSFDFLVHCGEGLGLGRRGGG